MSFSWTTLGTSPPRSYLFLELPALLQSMQVSFLSVLDLSSNSISMFFSSRRSSYLFLSCSSLSELLCHLLDLSSRPCLSGGADIRCGCSSSTLTAFSHRRSLLLDVSTRHENLLGIDRAPSRVVPPHRAERFACKSFFDLITSRHSISAGCNTKAPSNDEHMRVTGRTDRAAEACRP